MRHIIFTLADKERLTGSYGSHSHLKPLPLANGTEWAVGIEVLFDREYSEIYTELEALPQRELSPDDFLQNEN